HLFSHAPPTPPTPTLFPYTTLFRSRVLGQDGEDGARPQQVLDRPAIGAVPPPVPGSDDHDPPLARREPCAHRGGVAQTAGDHGGDRKSTRLNSSHVAISYAVFCLKK